MYGKGGAGLGAVKCFYKEYFKARHVGTVHTRCFVATDPQGDRYFNNVTYQAAHPEEPRMWEGQCNKMDVANRPGYLLNSVAIQNPLVPDLPSKVHGCESSPPEHKQGDYARTCKSMPVCFKIKVEGKAPHFVEPTPMQANSYDDDYKLVPGRTDVAACEGYGLELTIKAQDLDGDGVRIFVEDKDEDAAVASLLDKNLKGETYYVLAETYNLDFFNKTTMTFPAAAVGNSAGNNFEPYAAEKVGNNSRQESILPLDSMGAKSIASGYAPEIEYAAVAQQRIEYVLDPREKNGMLVRRASEMVLPIPRTAWLGITTRPCMTIAAGKSCSTWTRLSAHLLMTIRATRLVGGWARLIPTARLPNSAPTTLASLELQRSALPKVTWQAARACLGLGNAPTRIRFLDGCAITATETWLVLCTAGAFNSKHLPFL